MEIIKFIIALAFWMKNKDKLGLGFWDTYKAIDMPEDDLETHVEANYTKPKQAPQRHQAPARQRSTARQRTLEEIKTERHVVLDTETTGLTKDDRIVEIACLELRFDQIRSPEDLKKMKRLQYYVNPKKAVHDEALKVHLLSNRFLRNFPTFEEIAEDVLDFIGDSPVVAHNATFDKRFLEQEFERMGNQRKLREKIKVLKETEFIDTLPMSRRKSPRGSHTLGDVATRLGCHPGERMHGAMVDVITLAQVYIKLLEIDIGPGVLEPKDILQKDRQRKHIDLNRFIFAIGIPGVSDKKARLIAEKYRTLEEFLNKASTVANSPNGEEHKEMASIKGISKKAALQIAMFLEDEDSKEQIKTMQQDITVLPALEPKIEGSLIAGKNIVFTGEMENMTRPVAATLGIQRGANILAAINAKTDFVVVGRDPGPAKMKKIQELGIKTINEEEWNKIIED